MNITDTDLFAGKGYEGGVSCDPDPAWPPAKMFCCVQILNPENSGRLVILNSSDVYQGYYAALDRGPEIAGSQSAWSIRFCRYDTPLEHLWYSWHNLLTGALKGVAQIRYGGVSQTDFMAATQWRQHEGGDGRVNGSHRIYHRRVLYPGMGALWGVTAFGAMLRVTYTGKEEQVLP